MEELLRNSRIIICGGTGGVGKTTVSAALGVYGASMGLKVLVMTIDPARRLGTSLGLKIDGDAVVSIDRGYPGTLSATLVDAASVFERFVDDANVSERQKERLKRNIIYRQVSSTLSGSQEFTSLVRLYEFATSNAYDLVVLDTPPSDHAADFLYAPERISSLFEGEVVRFLSGSNAKLGVFNKLLLKSTTVWLKTLSILTGVAFINALKDFLECIGPFARTISEKARAAEQLLKGTNTAFVLVASPDERKLRQGKVFADELGESGYRLAALVINRAWPEWFMEQMTEPKGELGRVYRRMRTYYQERVQRIRRERLFSASGLEILEMPDFDGAVHGIEDLEELARWWKRSNNGYSAEPYRSAI